MKYLSELQPFCELLAHESAKIIKDYYRTGVSIEAKADNSPVTIADRKAEECMRTLINKEFPAHGICGEEFGVENKDAEYVWMLDPIDGTKSFICGVPLFGTLIALLKNGQPVLGVLNLPVLNELLIGDGQSTYLNNKIVKARECTDLSQAVLLNNNRQTVYQYQNGANFDKLAEQVNIYRGWGDCYGYYLVATGYADIMVDPIMSKWDTYPLIPIIKGAGAKISSYKGLDPVENYENIVACAAGIFDEVVGILNK